MIIYYMKRHSRHAVDVDRELERCKAEIERLSCEMSGTFAERDVN